MFKTFILEVPGLPYRATSLQVEPDTSLAKEGAAIPVSRVGPPSCSSPLPVAGGAE